MDNKTLILEKIREAGVPVTESNIVKSSGLDKKDVTKAFAILKKEGAITSPIRCKWEIAK